MTNENILKEIKKVFIPKVEEKKEKENEKKLISSPIIADGRKFIGSGEDAHLFVN